MKKKYKIGLHVLIWLLIFLNSFLPPYLNNTIRSFANRPNSVELFTDYLLIELGYLSMNIFAFYMTANLIAPLYLKYRKWAKGIGCMFLLFCIQPIYRYLLEYHFFLPYLNFDNYNGNTPTTLWYIKNIVLYTFYSYFIYGFVYFIIMEWYTNNRKRITLENEKTVAELAFLKSQINPHFLFNTLNDIYALTYYQSPQAPSAVLKLSALLRYMLKESDDHFTDLQKEIEYLRNVIELHKIGQKGSAYVNFEIEGIVENQQIAPLILINFVENAFKHGIDDDFSNPILIKLVLNPLHLIFSVSNLKNHSNKDKTVGIGLTNVKRRLALIYPEKHVLDVKDEANSFSIILKIETL
ncbi:histidine kinase [Pedobacter sp. Du54]|uniref:sensor histidine kinase n=1 Tax=Pedobacter anseongensis TaxID=3133439 RepID=UPI0030A7A461